MAIEGFARKFSLNPQPRGKQFRVEFAKARAAERRATQKLETALASSASAPSRADAEATGPPVNPLELMREALKRDTRERRAAIGLEIEILSATGDDVVNTFWQTNPAAQAGLPC